MLNAKMLWTKTLLGVQMTLTTFCTYRWTFYLLVSTLCFVKLKTGLEDFISFTPTQRRSLVEYRYEIHVKASSASTLRKRLKLHVSLKDSQANCKSMSFAYFLLSKLYLQKFICLMITLDLNVFDLQYFWKYRQSTVFCTIFTSVRTHEENTEVGSNRRRPPHQRMSNLCHLLSLLSLH